VTGSEAASLADLSRLAKEAARAYLQKSDPAAVHTLSELATDPNPDVARIGTEAIFRQVVEPLGDAFDPSCSRLYVRFFAQLLQCARALPEARWLNERLGSLGLVSEHDLIQRVERIRTTGAAVRDRVRKVLVLSRITLGADIAVTSVVLASALRVLPRAETVLLGSRKSGLLFAGEPRLRLRAIDYPRGGTLLQRLSAWPGLLEAAASETQGLAPEEYLIIDPDSRLTQLGMLPVAASESRYLFFDSRSFTHPPAATLADLTAAWCAERLAVDGPPARPWVSLPADSLARASVFRSSRCERCAAVNLGVGENPRKRLDEEFERTLLRALLDSGWRILLDRGEGSEELARAERIVSFFRSAGCVVASLDETSDVPAIAAAATADVTTWLGSLAGFAALIGTSDLYIGYDSACQHLAAALGVRTVSIFAGFQSARMVERWRPSGPGVVFVIPVDEAASANRGAILAQVLEAAR
jgi:hypothetical protein